MNIIQITALGWIGGIIGAIFLTMFIYAKLTGKENRFIVLSAVAFIIGFILFVAAILLYFNSTAVGEAKLKAWHAQSVGIERSIAVYSMDGTLIEEYHGIYNIEYDTERIEIYDTTTGERVIIYYKNGTVIVTEKATNNGS